jgi:hypothetical protein
MTSAERQARYRQKRKEQGLKRRDTWVSNEPAAKPEGKGDQTRRPEQNADRNRENGYIDGLCTAAAFLVKCDRADIAQSLLWYYAINRSEAIAALEKGTRSATLATLDSGGVFDVDS